MKRTNEHLLVLNAAKDLDDWAAIENDWSEPFSSSRHWKREAALLRDVAMFLDPEPEDDAIIIQAVVHQVIALANVIVGNVR